MLLFYLNERIWKSQHLKVEGRNVPEYVKKLTTNLFLKNDDWQISVKKNLDIDTWF